MALPTALTYSSTDWKGKALVSGQLIPRNLVATYVDLSTDSTPIWYLLGTRVEDAAIELNGDIEETTDILGNVYAEYSNIKPSMSMSPYPVTHGSAVHKILLLHYLNKDWAKFSTFKCMNVFGFVRPGTSGTTASAGFAAETYDACTLEITSLGGDTKTNMDFTIHFGGNVQVGHVASWSTNPSFNSDGATNILPNPNLSEQLAALTVTSVAGGSTGKTTISYTGYTISNQESYVYKIATAAETVTYAQELTTGWETWDGESDIVAENGKTITLAIITTSTSKANAAGSTTVVSAT